MAQSSNSSSLFDRVILGNLKKARVALVFTEWNDLIVSEQLIGCKRILNEFDAQVIVSNAVPGSFELPFACKKTWESFSLKPIEEQPEAIIAFGAVIRGGTPHFEYVSKAVTDGITQLNLMLPIPTVFGVLTVDNENQAWERLGGIHGHKGEEAALTALKMIHFCRENAK